MFSVFSDSYREYKHLSVLVLIPGDWPPRGAGRSADDLRLCDWGNTNRMNKHMEEGMDLSVSPGMSGRFHCVQGQVIYMLQWNSCPLSSLHLMQRDATPNTVPTGWQCCLLSNPPIPVLTSSGSQVAVEGNISLAHGQEVCADIWNDRRVHHDTWVPLFFSWGATTSSGTAEVWSFKVLASLEAGWRLCDTF